MSNFGALLKQEVARVARREVKVLVEPLRKTVTRQRNEIAQLKREAALQAKARTELQRQLNQYRAQLASQHARLMKAAQTDGDASVPVITEGTARRFSAKALAAWRRRLGLSAQDIADLLGGVSAAAVYGWEKDTRPKPAIIERLAEIREGGRRAALARLEKLRPR